MKGLRTWIFMIIMYWELHLMDLRISILGILIVNSVILINKMSQIKQYSIRVVGMKSFIQIKMQNYKYGVLLTTNLFMKEI